MDLVLVVGDSLANEQCLPTNKRVNVSDGKTVPKTNRLRHRNNTYRKFGTDFCLSLPERLLISLLVIFCLEPKPSYDIVLFKSRQSSSERSLETEIISSDERVSEKITTMRLIVNVPFNRLRASKSKTNCFLHQTAGPNAFL